MKHRLVALIACLFAAGSFAAPAAETTPPAPLCLWYPRPAQTWTEALPVGNGFMGAMVYGNPREERIQFNEYTIWTGQPRSYAHQGAVKVLPTLRQLLWAGKRKEAEALAMKEFMSVPLTQEAYQPCGELLIACHSGGDKTNVAAGWISTRRCA